MPKGKVLTRYGIPSRFTCSDITPRSYPWHIRTPEKVDEKGKKEGSRAESRRKEGKIETKIIIHAVRAQAESRVDNVAVFR